MKAVIINIMMLVALATTSFHVVAQSEPHDTVYFFKTWNQMLRLKPKVMVIDPVIQQNSHDEFEFIAVDPKLTQTMANKYIAARIGDGDWLINSEYLKMCFEGMRDYKNPEIIEDYFYRYIDRISQDDSRPRILDFNPSTID